jgi:hypothetical protein
MALALTARGKRSGSASALLIGGAVALLALPSAVLAFSSRFDVADEGLPVSIADDGFVPSQVDPRLARSITVRALSKGRTFRFTPAATPNRMDSAIITVAVRLPGNRVGLRSGGAGAEQAQGEGGLRIAQTAYSLGAARGYRSFAQGSGAGNSDLARLEMPDLASYRPRAATGTGTPSRFEPHIALDEREKTGRSPRTFEQSDQTVDLGGAYRLTRNINVTAGVRYSSDRDRLVPLTDGRQDSQAVYVGTQFRF